MHLDILLGRFMDLFERLCFMVKDKWDKDLVAAQRQLKTDGGRRRFTVVPCV